MEVINSKIKRINKKSIYLNLESVKVALRDYLDKLNGKNIYVITDNMEKSGIWKFLKNNFKKYNIKSLSTLESLNGNYYIYDGKKLKKEKVDYFSEMDLSIHEEKIKEADLIIGFPKNNALDKLVLLCFDLKKDFILHGTNNILTYDYIIDFFSKDKMKLFRKSPTMYLSSTGGKTILTNNSWFTNIGVESDDKKIYPKVAYNKEIHLTYENLNGIEVQSVDRIPRDYYGLMGLPITYLSHHNPKYFEIVALDMKLLYDENIVNLGVRPIGRKLANEYNLTKAKNKKKLSEKSRSLIYLKDGVPILPAKRVIIRRNPISDGDLLTNCGTCGSENVVLMEKKKFEKNNYIRRTNRCNDCNDIFVSLEVVNEKLYENVCLYCGENFVTTNKLSKYCPSCSTKINRIRSRINTKNPSKASLVEYENMMTTINNNMIKHNEAEFERVYDMKEMTHYAYSFSLDQKKSLEDSILSKLELKTYFKDGSIIAYKLKSKKTPS